MLSQQSAFLEDNISWNTVHPQESLFSGKLLDIKANVLINNDDEK